jgi:hypothetical protein
MDVYSLSQHELQNYVETDLCFQIILCKLLDRTNRSSWMVQFLGTSNLVKSFNSKINPKRTFKTNSAKLYQSSVFEGSYK